MKGQFSSRRMAVVVGIIFTVMGLGFAAFMIFLSVADTLASGETVITLRTVALAGGIVAYAGIFQIGFNKNAFLSLDENGVSAKYGFMSRLECAYNDIEFADISAAGLTIFLTNGKMRTISGLKNTVELCEMLRIKTYRPSCVDNKTFIEDFRALYKRRKALLALTVGMIILMFVLILIAALLTGDKEFNEFNSFDRIVFTVFILCEAPTFVFMFIFAAKAGKLTRKLNNRKLLLSKQFLESAPLPPGVLLHAFLTLDYSERVCIFGYPNSNDVYYTVEQLDESIQPVIVYTSPVYQNISMLDFDMSLLIRIPAEIGTRR